MLLYALTCHECGTNQDHFLDVDNPDPVPCEGCGFVLTRAKNPNYQAKGINIQGETCPGSTQYAGWDDGMQCHVDGKDHRKRLMDERGLVPFVADPVAANHRDTVRHIKKNSQPGDPEAAKAISKENKEADSQRRRTGVERAFKNVTYDKTMNAGR